jgi:hypothetical protein
LKTIINNSETSPLADLASILKSKLVVYSESSPYRQAFIEVLKDEAFFDPVCTEVEAKIKSFGNVTTQSVFMTSLSSQKDYFA